MSGLLLTRSHDSGGLALDGLPASAAAYSVRKLRSAYTGPALRVRRSSDNAEADVGFTAAGDLDTDQLLLHAGQNLFAQSGDLTTGWGFIGVAVGAAGTGVQDQPAFFLEETATSGNHYVFQSRTYTPGAQQVVSFDVKDNGRGFAHFLFNAQISIFAANIDLSTGATNIVGGAGTGTITATSLGSGWWRVDVGITVGSGGLGSAYVGGASSLAMGRNGAYLGVPGTGILVSRPQIVDGSVARGYARTDAVALDGNGAAVTWYDQSGNERHATQGNANNQPRIVDAGVVVTDGLARPALSLDGTDFLSTTLSPDRTAFPELTVSAVYRTTNLVTFKALWGADNGGFDRGQLLGSDGNNWGFLAGNTSISQAAVLSTIAPVVYAATLRVGVASGSSVAANGVQNTAFTEVLGSSHGTFGIGSLSSGGQFPMFGFVREMVVVASALSAAQRQALERNQGAYFGITVA